MSLVLPGIALCNTNEPFPNVHNDPITVRILNGKYGAPITRAHLTLTGGYDERDLGLKLWREELQTDKNGEARLPNGLANLPFLQLSVAKHKLCQSHPKAGVFSVERMRRDGLSTPNRCGAVMVEDAPGVFTVFVSGGNETRSQLVARLAAPISHAPATASPATAAQTPVPAVSQPIAATAAPTDRASNLKPPATAGDAPTNPSQSHSSASKSAASDASNAAPAALLPAAGMDRFFFSNPPPAPTILPAPAQNAPRVVQIPSVNPSAIPSSTLNADYPPSAAVSTLGPAEAVAKLAAQKTIQTPSATSPSVDQTGPARDSPSGFSEPSPTPAKSKSVPPRSRRPHPARKTDEAPDSEAGKQTAKAQNKQPAPDAGKQPKPAAAQNPKSAGTKPRAGAPADPAKPDSSVPKAKPHASRSKKLASGACEAPAKK